MNAKDTVITAIARGVLSSMSAIEISGEEVTPDRREEEDPGSFLQPRYW